MHIRAAHNSHGLYCTSINTFGAPDETHKHYISHLYGLFSHMLYVT